MDLANLTYRDLQVFLEHHKYAIILFDAAWDIGPGAAIRKSLTEAVELLSEVVCFAQVDVDREPELTRWAGVLNVPAIAYCKDGRIVATLVGCFQNIYKNAISLIEGKELGFGAGLG